MSEAISEARPGNGVPASAIRSVLASSPIWLGAVGVLVAVDAFHAASQLGQARSLLFWTLLVCLNVAAWAAWRRLDARWMNGPVHLLVGALTLNLLLTLEVPAVYRMLGASNATPEWRAFVYGMLATMLVTYVRRRRVEEATPSKTTDRATVPDASVAVPLPATPDLVRPRILTQAGVEDPLLLLAVRAEDHYCRLLLEGGRSALVHYRFGDAVADLAPLDGAQIHRSVWVASRAVENWRRDGRRWTVRLTDGTDVPMSEGSSALCRERGWRRSPDVSA